ncbi:MAG: ribulose-phosphate 3-epimerase [Oscillospiraceae bacterium]|nr:ribulose-phosphate 3-epimerase [Oscillospiraceae bacterium]MDD4368085.1 ribulose-phosphate 3-epimerase [Oscillospiraceae bacterium]
MHLPEYQPDQRRLYLSPSILAADFWNLSDAVTAVQADADALHIDVMDGIFVPSISYGFPIIEALKRHHYPLPLDVHLMIEDASRYIRTFAEAGADMLTVHAEACVHLQRTLAEIRACGMAAAVCLNPATPLHVLEEVLPYIDMVLIMSVNPGFGGQTFLDTTLEKITRLRQWLDRTPYPIHIEVDGGITTANIAQVCEAGADVVVAGSAVFGSGQPAESLRKMRARCER